MASKPQFFIDIENDNVTAVEKAITGAANKTDFLKQMYDGMTPVIYAVCMMSAPSLEVILKHGGDPYDQMENAECYGLNAIEYSIRKKRRDCTALLKKAAGLE